MSRTTLCGITAAILIIGSLSSMIVRRQILGDAVKVPRGPGTWKVAMVVQGVSQGDAHLQTAAPLDFGRQHISLETCRSKELLDKLPYARHPQRRHVLWSLRGGAANRPFRARYEFYCTIDVHRPTSSMSNLTATLYAAPQEGEHLDVESNAGADKERFSAVARALVEGHERTEDQAEALFRYVAKEVDNEPYVTGPGASASDCLFEQSGDSGAKSRLLAALLRNRGIPARIVTGLALAKGHEQQAHHWVEAWLHDHWLPMCPFNHYYGRVPPTYLVFGLGDLPVVRGRHVRDLDYAFLVERASADDAAAHDASTPRRLLASLSLYHLPPAELRLVEFLLLLPLAALIICLFRNVIGLDCFGTFAPALVGLAFRDLHSLPGMLVFVSIILLGWIMRRVLDRYHLLQVPRTSVLLSLIVVVLVGAIVVANYQELPATRYVSLFPMVILTGMIERFWTLETEDSTLASFKTLLGTLVVSASIALVLSLHAVVNQMVRYPETLGLIVAGQLLLGRYTGYRLSELFRFRDFLRTNPRRLSLFSE